MWGKLFLTFFVMNYVEDSHWKNFLKKLSKMCHKSVDIGIKLY